MDFGGADAYVRNSSAIIHVMLHCICYTVSGIAWTIAHVLSILLVHYLPMYNLCSYEASLQDIQNGVLRMHRRVTSNDVKGYASHIPGQEVDLDKEEDLVYKKGVLTHASGTASCKLMTQVIQLSCWGYTLRGFKGHHSQ